MEIRVNGDPEYVVLGSCCNGSDASHAGLFSFDGTSVERLSRRDSTGLCAAGERVARLIQPPGGVTVTELLIYSSDGSVAHLQLPDVWDPHDVAWDGEHFVVVSTSGNCLCWYTRQGELVKQWKAPGESDSWHLNCLLVHQGEVYLSAFGRFEQFRGWAAETSKDTGILLHIPTQEIVLRGLVQPHTPRFLDGGWVICNSRARELLQFDDTGRHVTRRLALCRYARGLAVTDDYLFIGESLSRNDATYSDDQPRQYASVAVVSRRDWTVVDRFAAPGNEVYDLLMVKRALAQHMREDATDSPHEAAASQNESTDSQTAEVVSANVSPVLIAGS